MTLQEARLVARILPFVWISGDRNEREAMVEVCYRLGEATGDAIVRAVESGRMTLDEACAAVGGGLLESQVRTKVGRAEGGPT